jgi:hypothetical protein
MCLTSFGVGLPATTVISPQIIAIAPDEAEKFNTFWWIPKRKSGTRPIITTRVCKIKNTVSQSNKGLLKKITVRLCVKAALI